MHFGHIGAWARKMTRLADSMRLPEPTRRGRVVADQAPAGPTLVRGRGLARRRPRPFLGGVLRALLFLLLALGVVVVAVRWL